MIEDINRVILLRALEWARWPLFIVQPIMPVLLIFTTWQVLIPLVLIIDLLWEILIRYRFISFRLAIAGMYLVRLKWITCPLMGIYFYIHGHIINSIIALFWPLITLFLTGLTALILSPWGPVNLLLIERKFRAQIGFYE